MSGVEVLFTPHTVEISNRIVLGIHVHSHIKVKFILLSSRRRRSGVELASPWL